MRMIIDREAREIIRLVASSALNRSENSKSIIGRIFDSIIDSKSMLRQVILPEGIICIVVVIIANLTIYLLGNHCYCLKDKN